MDIGDIHIEAIPALWLILSAVALWITIGNLLAAYQDRSYAKTMHNGMARIRLLQADAEIFRNRVRMLIFAWWTLIGIVFSFFETPDVVGLLGLLGLVATVLGHIVIGMHSRLERRALDALMIKQMEAHEELSQITTENIGAEVDRRTAALIAAQAAAEAAHEVAETARLRAEEIARRVAADAAASSPSD